MLDNVYLLNKHTHNMCAVYPGTMDRQILCVSKGVAIYVAEGFMETEEISGCLSKTAKFRNKKKLDRFLKRLSEILDKTNSVRIEVPGLIHKFDIIRVDVSSLPELAKNESVRDRGIELPVFGHSFDFSHLYPNEPEHDHD